MHQSDNSFGPDVTTPHEPQPLIGQRYGEGKVPIESEGAGFGENERALREGEDHVAHPPTEAEGAGGQVPSSSAQTSLFLTGEHREE
ncbi:MAG: hypothetical protein ABEI06_01715 [Halobacteriaceae archaeon]